MATIKELIRTEAAGGISFCNYELIMNMMVTYIK